MFDGDRALGAPSVLELVMAVWEACPGRAHAVLRGRISTCAPITDLDRAVVKVVAKRLVAADRAPEGALPLPLEPALHRARQAALPLPPADTDWAAWLAAAEPGPGPNKTRDRPIRAVLVDADGAPLWAARHAGGLNRALHAEVALLQGWGRPVPVGAQVLVTLQPCRMCAALLVARATAAVDVRYLNADPGRFARGTAIQNLGWERAL